MRTRNVVREDLRKTVAKCKNTQSIETILKIAEIYRKVYDNAAFKEVSELQGIYGRYAKDKNFRQRYTVDCCHIGAYRSTTEILGI